MAYRTLVDSFERITVWAGLIAVSALTAVQQTDFQIVKQTLLSVHPISTETRRKKVFKQTFNASKPDQWLRDFKQNFHQWLDSMERPTIETVLMELVLAKLPNWLENQIAISTVSRMTGLQSHYSLHRESKANISEVCKTTRKRKLSCQ